MRWKASIGLFVLTLAFEGRGVPDALAGPPTDQLRSRMDQVLGMLGDGDAKRDRPRERRAALRKVVDDIFDWEETAKRSLGSHWQQRTPDEREEFVRLFGELLGRSYLSKIEIYDGEKIGYTGDAMDGDQAAVQTKIINKQGTEILVTYRMLLREGDRWKVYDVEIEGVSLIANYRTQFNNLLRRSSYPQLVSMLKAKAAEPEPDAHVAEPRR